MRDMLFDGSHMVSWITSILLGNSHSETRNREMNTSIMDIDTATQSIYRNTHKTVPDLEQPRNIPSIEQSKFALFSQLICPLFLCPLLLM